MFALTNLFNFETGSYVGQAGLKLYITEDALELQILLSLELLYWQYLFFLFSEVKGLVTLNYKGLGF